MNGFEHVIGSAQNDRTGGAFEDNMLRGGCVGDGIIVIAGADTLEDADTLEGGD
ncbi:MAG: hypothetical protein AAGM38_00445 [Pseudomonadota bacterium]